MAEDAQTQFLKDAKSASKRMPMQVTVRDLLAHWNYRKRGAMGMKIIERALSEYGLRTRPLLAEVASLDGHVTLVGVSSAVEPEQEVGLRVGQLRSAQGGVMSIAREKTLREAQTLMMLHDYSQLAVSSGLADIRAVTWESIARAQLVRSDAELGDAAVPARAVELHDDLIPLISVIAAENFVFVRGKEKTLGGIVTAADLSREFENLASPFFLLSEIERRLRRVIERRFALEEIKAMVNATDTKRTVEGAGDLSFGEIVHHLEAGARRLRPAPRHAERGSRRRGRHRGHAHVNNNGQSCTAGKRFIVHTDVYQEFAGRFAERMAKLRVDDPVDEATDVSPLATASGRDDVRELVDDAVARGATIRAAGDSPDGPGWFVAPTVLEGVTPEMRIYAEEAFGPVATLYRAANREDAARIANDTTFGLSSASGPRAPTRRRSSSRRSRRVPCS